MTVRNEGGPATGRALDPCPICDRADMLWSVPAVYQRSRSMEQSAGRANGVLLNDDAGLAQRSAARARLATAAPVPVRSALLAPAPANYAVAGGAGAVVLAGLSWFLWGMDRASRSAAQAGLPDNRVPYALALACTALSALCLVVMVLSIPRRIKIKLGRADAAAVWRRGWYCERCAAVFFRDGEEPFGVEPGAALDPRSFRDAVWNVGGYARRGRSPR